MTHQEIQVFLAVAKLGSVSAAAQALYITQPAVSRHIHTLEQKLGCTLLTRGRGQRMIGLTPQGHDFIELAQKWILLWQEAQELKRQDREQLLNVASVGSVSSYLLPNVLRRYLSQHPQHSLTFHNYHSQESYSYVAEGLVDLALISNNQHHPQVNTTPLFSEPMVLLSSQSSTLPDEVHPSQLDPFKELRCPWNPSFDMWHNFWFSTCSRPLAEIDQMSMLESFFLWTNSWAITPISAAYALQQKCGAKPHVLKEGPTDRIIYSLTGQRQKSELITSFLTCLSEELMQYPEIKFFQPQHQNIQI